jgi:hypothetical protein
MLQEALYVARLWSLVCLVFCCTRHGEGGLTRVDP